MSNCLMEHTCEVNNKKHENDERPHVHGQFVCYNLLFWFHPAILDVQKLWYLI